MSSTVILAAAAAFALGCVFCLGLWWLSTHRSKRGRTETMKATVWAVSRSQNSYPGKPSQRSLP